MNAKERRERLFKNGRPLVRELHLMNGEGYSKDMGILWAAYKAGSFDLPQDLEQEKFAEAMSGYLSGFQKTWVVDDKNSGFKSGSGPVALVVGNAIGLVVETQFGFFKWASARNILRSTVSFLNMIKNSSKTGVCLVRAPREKRLLPDHLKDYEMLYYIGRTADNEYLYS